MTALTIKPTNMVESIRLVNSVNSSPIAIPKDKPNVNNIKYKMIAENVTVSYGGIDAVKNVTMKFKENSVTALIGPSGCGKLLFLDV